jgi:hypothetical protein
VENMYDSIQRNITYTAHVEVFPFISTVLEAL